MKGFTLVIEGERKVATPTPGDMVRFERQYATGFTGERLEHVMYLAWLSLTRTKQIECDFESFLDTVEPFETEEESDPFEAASPPS